MITNPMLWIEVGAAGYLTWEASCHINHQNKDTWSLIPAFWALLGGAAMWSITGAATGNPPDPLRMSLVVLVALACGFDRRRFDRGMRLRYLRQMRQQRGRRHKPQENE